MKIVWPYKMQDYRHVQEEPKLDQMGKFRREVDFLERGMQRVRIKLQKLQQDPTQTPSMSMVGLKPKQIVDQYDCHVMEQGKVQDTHGNDRYIGLYSTIEQQIRADAMLPRHIYEEEWKQFEKQIREIEN